MKETEQLGQLLQKIKEVIWYCQEELKENNWWLIKMTHLMWIRVAGFFFLFPKQKLIPSWHDTQQENKCLKF